MQASRTVVRASRQARCFKHQFRQTRLESTSTASQSGSGSSPALIGALSGAAASVVLGYGWYQYSGTAKLVNTAKETQDYVLNAQQKFKQQVQEKAPSPNEALKWLRQVSTYYAGFIPGASGFVNTTFDDLEKVRGKHGEEVDKIVSEAYNELKGLAKQDMSLQTAQQAWEIIQKHTERIAKLAGDAAEDILENHPQLKDTVGNNVKQLKQMGDQYGPQAKEQVEKAWNEVRDAAKNGINPETVNKIRKIIQEKVEQVKKFGDEAWQKGLEQAKPLLDKSPKVKQLIEENADVLKQGNIAELWNKVKDAANSSDTGDLEQYVKQAKDKAHQAVGGGDWDQYLKLIPGGGDLGSKIQQLQQIATAKGPEAKKLLEATMKDLEGILSKRSEEAKKLADEARKGEK